MLKTKRLILVGSLLIAGAIGLSAPPAQAINVFNACANGGDSAVCKGKNDSASTLMTTVISTMLLLIGSIAVIMIIIGGIRYTTSNGDPSKVKSAKDTILYSVIGLVVAIGAYAIVKFVLNRL